METQVDLVRHAESDLNAHGRHLVGGRSNACPLSPAGQAAARQRGAALAASGYLPDAVLCTSAVRSAETARLLVEGARWRLPVTVDDAFLELSQGIAEGQPRERWWTERALAEMRADPLGHRLSEGGESHAEVQERMITGILGLARAHPGGTVLVVGHGIAMRTLAWKLLGGGHETFMGLALPNLGRATFLADAALGAVRLASWPEETA